MPFSRNSQWFLELTHYTYHRGFFHRCNSTSMSSPNSQKAPEEPKSQNGQDPQKAKIDWKLLDQQNADLDDDLDYESDSDHHGCSCCAGLVGTIQ